MSKLKVGDRVRYVYHGDEFDGTIKDFESCTHASVQFDHSDRLSSIPIAHLRRLVKRKHPKPAAPDRVMVAAALMSFVSRWNTPRDLESDEDYAKRMRAISLEQADALIAEGAK